MPSIVMRIDRFFRSPAPCPTRALVNNIRHIREYENALGLTQGSNRPFQEGFEAGADPQNQISTFQECRMAGLEVGEVGGKPIIE